MDTMAIWYLNIVACTAKAAIPLSPALRDTILQQSKWVYCTWLVLYGHAYTHCTWLVLYGHAYTHCTWLVLYGHAYTHCTWLVLYGHCTWWWLVSLLIICGFQFLAFIEIFIPLTFLSPPHTSRPHTHTECPWSRCLRYPSLPRPHSNQTSSRPLLSPRWTSSSPHFGTNSNILIISW